MYYMIWDNSAGLIINKHLSLITIFERRDATYAKTS